MSFEGQEQPRPRQGRAEVEIPAGPEEVWEAITTAAGYRGWGFPTEIEPRAGGSIRIDRGEHGLAEGTVTAWEPPRRLAYDIAPFATEFVVEARAGGTCVVRVVDTLHGDDGGWEDMVDLVAQGWRMALASLRGYLTHFAGQAAVDLQVGATSGVERDEFTHGLLQGLGIAGLGVGERFRSPEDTPALAGTVEDVMEHFVLLHTEEPGPGLVQVATMKMGPEVTAGGMFARLYGPDAAATAAREQPAWQAWFSEHFQSMAS